jgi:hypothetical protein
MLYNISIKINNLDTLKYKPERKQKNMSTTEQESSTQTITGYQLSKVVNVKLEDAGLAAIPSQMIYNYMKNGMIPFTVVDGKKVITVEDARVWITKYIAKKRNGSNSTADLLKSFEDATETDEVTLEAGDVSELELEETE